ncbi:MFS transporter [Catenulispora sp. NF23]|uniref:MFS transporter n=1 Tax=Catenulispora pinistramenti TaxID=2705254 RepID=A0ABS5L837_9ACTN|nr:MFS transporter [Catenulispora pinistramenti]MBS2539786.1 MFS transporter [Catenulispora pinistramenti]MBS2554531.1 MFS transporter [Catenulispora pinistramenti]
MTTTLVAGTETGRIDTKSDMRVPLPLTVAAFTANFDRFAVAPILVTIAAAMHKPLTAVVTLASGYALAYGLSQPVWGILSDRIGRLRVVRLALTIAAIAGLASAVMPGLALLSACRFVAGFAFGAAVPSSLSFVGDAVAPERRHNALADLMAALGLGSGLAALFAGIVAHWVSWRWVFAVPALVALTTVVLLRGVEEPERAKVGGLREQIGAVLHAPYAYVVTALGIVEGAVLLGGLTFVAPALEHRGLSSATAGALTALYGAGTLAFTRVVKALTRRIPAHGLAAIGGALVVVGYGCAVVAPGTATYALVATLLGAGWAFLHSTLQTWATSVVPHARGTAVSFYVAALFVGSALGAMFGSGAASRGEFGLLFGVCGVVTIPLTVAVVIGRRRFVARG